MRVVWQNHAKIELKEAVQYYRVNAGDHVAHDFRNEVRRLTRQLIEHPEIGMRIHHEIRRYVMHDRPFNLVYLSPDASGHHHRSLGTSKPPARVLGHPAVVHLPSMTWIAQLDAMGQAIAMHRDAR